MQGVGRRCCCWGAPDHDDRCSALLAMSVPGCVDLARCFQGRSDITPLATTHNHMHAQVPRMGRPGCRLYLTSCQQPRRRRSPAGSRCVC